MTAPPLPNPAAVVVGQSGTAALWNAGYPPSARFLAGRPYAVLTQTVAQPLAANTDTTIQFTTAVDNTGAAWTAANPSRYTAQTAGVHHVIGQVGIQPPATAGATPNAEIRIRLNGGTPNPTWGPVRVLLDLSTGSGHGGLAQIAAAVVLAAGDIVDLSVTNNNGSTLTTWADYRASRMFVHWVST